MCFFTDSLRTGLRGALPQRPVCGIALERTIRQALAHIARTRLDGLGGAGECTVHSAVLARRQRSQARVVDCLLPFGRAGWRNAAERRDRGTQEAVLRALVRQHWLHNKRSMRRACLKCATESVHLCLYCAHGGVVVCTNRVFFSRATGAKKLTFQHCSGNNVHSWCAPNESGKVAIKRETF